MKNKKWNNFTNFFHEINYCQLLKQAIVQLQGVLNLELCDNDVVSHDQEKHLSLVSLYKQCTLSNAHLQNSAA